MQVDIFSFYAGLGLLDLGFEYNVPIDVDIKFDPNPISWTLKIP